MKKFTGLLSLMTLFFLTAFCISAFAYPDDTFEQQYNDEHPYEIDDTGPGEYDEKYPAEEPIFNEDDFQSDDIEPEGEYPGEPLPGLGDGEDLQPSFEDSPGDLPDELPSINDPVEPFNIEQYPSDEPNLEIPPDTPVLDYPSPDQPLVEPGEEAGGSSAGLNGEPLFWQTTPAQCEQAAGHVIIMLESRGINSGVTYVKPGAEVELSNQSGATHRITISPAGFFDKNSATLNPHSTVAMTASSPTQVTVGKIVVNTGNSQTKHFVVICP